MISGRLVPIATMLRPIATSLRPTRSAMPTAPLTVNSEPRASVPIPASRKTISRVIPSLDSGSRARVNSSPRGGVSLSRCRSKERTTKAMSPTNRAAPMTCPIIPLRPARMTATVATPSAGISHRSRLGWTSMGRTSDAMPSTSNTFVMFEPNTFPTASPPDPSSAAAMLTDNSGEEVPRATTVAPTIRGEMPNANDSRAAALTSSQPPARSTASPAAVSATSKISDVMPPRPAQPCAAAAVPRCG